MSSTKARARYVDVAALLQGGSRAPRPSAGSRRTDGLQLLYTGAVNGIVGESESGKTLIALAHVADTLADGFRAVFVDLDHNGATAIVSRLLEFGVKAGVLGDPDRFRLAADESEPRDRDEMLALADDMDAWKPRLIVVDSVGELMPLMGADSDNGDQYTSVHRQVLKRMARAGVAVLIVDHPTKAGPRRGAPATGTSAKMRAIDGFYGLVKVIEKFAPGRGGRAEISIIKDRHGGVRGASPAAGGRREQLAATFAMKSNAEGFIEWQFLAPKVSVGSTQGSVSAPNEDLQELLRMVPPPRSKEDVKSRTSWGSDRALRALQAYRTQDRSRTDPGPLETVRGAEDRDGVLAEDSGQEPVLRTVQDRSGPPTQTPAVLTVPSLYKRGAEDRDGVGAVTEVNG